MIILFNGPPGAGKDLAADFFKTLGFKHLSFKYQLFKETIKFFNVKEDWFMTRYNNRQEKELPHDLLHGMSCREAMIHVSENIIKPKEGLDYFGKLVADEIDLHKNYCVSDGGFVHELIPVINKVSSDNFILVQLTRSGHDYSSDSRRYLDGHLYKEYIVTHQTPVESKYVLPHKFNVKMYRIHNNGTIEEFNEVLKDIYEKEVNGRSIKKTKEAA